MKTFNRFSIFQEQFLPIVYKQSKNLERAEFIIRTIDIPFICNCYCHEDKTNLFHSGIVSMSLHQPIVCFIAASCLYINIELVGCICVHPRVLAALVVTAAFAGNFQRKRQRNRICKTYL